MKEKVYVWDPLVRFFHWTLVLGFVIAYLTGDDENTLHIYAGYYILGLVGIRILWGFIGTRHARFADFIYSPSAVFDYLKGFLGISNGKRYLGHNPAGGWMVIALLVSLLLTGVSGLKVYGVEGQGPLAQRTQAELSASGLVFLDVSAEARDDHERDEHDDEEDEKTEAGETSKTYAANAGDYEAGKEFWEEMHEFAANFTLFLVFLHIAGVIASSLKQRQNLFNAMISGYKTAKE